MEHCNAALNNALATDDKVQIGVHKHLKSLILGKHPPLSPLRCQSRSLARVRVRVRVRVLCSPPPPPHLPFPFPPPSPFLSFSLARPLTCSRTRVRARSLSGFLSLVRSLSRRACATPLRHAIF